MKKSSTYNDLFLSITNPTRRKILDVLTGNPQDKKTIAKKLRLSKGSIARHLKILANHKILDIKPLGKRNIYIAKPYKLDAVRDWLVSLKHKDISTS